jgi:hypothetical protein
VTSLGQTLVSAIGATSTNLSIDLVAVRNRFVEIYGAEIVDSCDDISHRVAVLDAGGAEFVDKHGRALGLLDGNLGQLASGSDAVAFLEIVTGGPASRAFSRADLEVWSTFCGVTARFLVAVEAACPVLVGSDEADPRVCTLDPLSCPEGLQYSSKQKLCKPAGMGRVFVLSLVIGLASVVFLLVLAAVVLMRRNRRLNHNLEQLIRAKDNTLDLDSPLTKVIRFLESVPKHLHDSQTKLQAQELHMLLLSADNVTVPTMQQVTDNLNDEMARFLMVGSNKREKRRRQSSSIGRESDNGRELLYSSNSDFGEILALGLEQEVEVERLERCVGENWFVDALRVHELLGSRALETVVMHLMSRWSVLETLGVSPLKMQRFVTRVQAGYQDNPYHNVAHAVDVTCRYGAILHHSGICAALVKQGRDGALRIFAMIVAAAVHDFGHPGFSNAYTVKMEMEVAQKFNDQATLENYSLFSTLQMMNSPEEGGGRSLIGHLGRDRRMQLRRLIIKLVLGTDMSKHFELMTAFKNKVVDSSPSSGVSATSLGQEQGDLVAVMALKVADLGHNALPLDVHLQWLRRLEEEFFAQGDLEKKNDLEVSPLMDRCKPGACDPSNQMGFCTVIVLPVYTAWCQAFPECKPLKRVVQENMSHWEKRVQRTDF